jgi:putative salt-induced outer membrane protein YdiY
MVRTSFSGLLPKGLALFAFFLSILTSTAAKAQEEAASRVPADVMAPPRMPAAASAPVFDAGKYDWVRLGSGEWLKGDILSMRDRKFEFDSDELDEQTFDWEDVVEFRSSRMYTYVFTDRTRMIGTAVILEDKVILSSLAGADTIRERFELMSIVPAGDRERDRWDGKASLGLAFRRGNTEQTDLTYQGFIRRRDALTRTRLDSNGAIGEVEGVQTVNNHRSVLKLDLFVTPRFYLTPIAVSLYHDKFQNIEIQIAPSAGIGVHAIDKRKITCDLELAGGYQYTLYQSVEPGVDNEKGNGGALATIRIETDPTQRIEADFLYSAQVGIPETEETTMHGEAILSIEITKVLDLDISWIWDRVQSPQPNEDGTVPEKDDVKLTVGVGIDF